MPRQLRFIFPAALLGICLTFSGCKTVYSDMYSPRRSYFVPPKEKKPEVPPLIEETVTPSTSETPAGLLPSPAPSSAPAPAPTTPADPVLPGLTQ
jgi:hypothetical protein